MAGIQDVWGFTEGHTKTTVNYAIATYNALMETAVVKLNEKITLNLAIYKGGGSNVRSDQN